MNKENMTARVTDIDGLADHFVNNGLPHQTIDGGDSAINLWFGENGEIESMAIQSLSSQVIILSDGARPT